MMSRNICIESPPEQGRWHNGLGMQIAEGMVTPFCGALHREMLSTTV